MENMLELKIGKPALEKTEIKNPETGEVEQKFEYAQAATYTRFALPFAFQLQAAPDISEPADLYYALNDKEDISYIKRRKYFTRETSDTLYERGEWLSICNNWKNTSWGKAEITVSLRNKDFQIGMLPPQLVLFEVPEIKHQQEANILQTGVLYVDLYFSEQQSHTPELDDLLLLNEYFRYFGIPYDGHATIFKKLFANIPVNVEQNITKPQSGSETIASLDSLACYFERWATMLEIPLKYNGQSYRLFPKNWGQAARNWMYNKKGCNEADHWQIYADNRCFVWTLALLKEGGKSLQTNFEPEKEMLAAKDYGHWVKLLNIDTPIFNFKQKFYEPPIKTHSEVSKFERQWADERTYKRWEESGTWYGFCYHSVAVLDKFNPADGSFSLAFPPSATYYFDSTMLLFYIRLSLFRFGRELSKVIAIKDKEQKRENLQALRDQFATFTVLYRFPMPSNQQQSIEMYEINRKFFDLDRFFDEIQHEIDNTHEFLQTVEANRLADYANRRADIANGLATSANKLADWGIPLAAGGLVAGLFGMNDFQIWQCNFGAVKCTLDMDLVLQVGVIVIASIGLIFGKNIINYLKKQE